MTKHWVALAIGALLAALIACGGGKSASHVDNGGGATNPRSEIDQLDAEITADMAKMQEARPAAAPNTCTTSCAPQAMSSAATAATAPDPSCKPASSATCTESCSLKKSICDAAGRICNIAADLGGSDSYANDKCNNGSASCEAAKKRCCNCT
jgi:hypothetical protein